MKTAPMQVITLGFSIQLLDYWQAGSGQSSGMDTDVLPVMDAQKLPYIPGRTIKGLFKDAAEQVSLFQSDRTSVISQLFGMGNKVVGADAGSKCHFSNAELNPILAQSIIQQNLQASLVKKMPFTAISEGGQVKDKSLRKITFYKPMTLYGTIGDFPCDLFDEMKIYASFIKRLGGSRNRGFGRCIIRLNQPKI